MMIDIFPHIIPEKYKEVLYKKLPGGFFGAKWIETIPTLTNLDARFRIMDQHPGLVQVLTMGNPPLEKVLKPKDAAEVCIVANDSLAELVGKYPDRFVAAVASLPLNNIDASLKEIDRVVNDLRFRGIQIHSPLDNKPLDSPEFFPIYQKMSEYNLPIWIHPLRDLSHPDYDGEDSSKYLIFSTIGWPFETTKAMVRLVFSGVFDKFPNLKIITHHGGGMLPFYAARMTGFYEHNEMRLGFKHNLKEKPMYYFRKFYADTAIYNSTPGLTCCQAFFGAEHVLFGTDMPYDSQLGYRQVREVIEAIEAMEISDADKKLIFEDNARRLLRLPI
jgi:predicted TIM-barrel fold metal-dependent hydrolase